MPSYGGINIFGRGVSMQTVDNPRAEQNTGFAGLSGVESLDMGLRGRFTVASGLLIGATSGDLYNAEALFRSYNDGISRPLIDMFGVTWINVKMISYEPQGRVKQDVWYGYSRPYTARFKHLT